VRRDCARSSAAATASARRSARGSQAATDGLEEFDADVVADACEQPQHAAEHHRRDRDSLGPEALRSSVCSARVGRATGRAATLALAARPPPRTSTPRSSRRAVRRARASSRRRILKVTLRPGTDGDGTRPPRAINLAAPSSTSRAWSGQYAVMLGRMMATNLRDGVLSR
jgi:hypothetical protein